MGLCRAEVVFQAASAIPADAVRATWWFNTTGTPPTPADMTEIGSLIVSFYNDVNASGASLGQYLSRSISRDALAHEIRYYNGSAIGPPIGTSSAFSIGPVLDNVGLPSEIAACLTYHADMTGVPEFAAGIRPRSRLRGRFFFGPLCAAANVLAQDPAPGFRTRLDPVLINDLCQSASRVLGTPSPLTTWVVYSRTVGIGFPVVAGWVDDAFDVQRRRGEAAVGRQLWA